MIILAAFLAQGSIGGHPKEKATDGGLPPSTHETIPVIGVLVVITLALLLLAYLLRRKRRRDQSSSPHPSLWSQIKSQRDTVATQGDQRRRKGDRHRREHRPRNPTRAETGGLPPIRSEDPPPPAPPP